MWEDTRRLVILFCEWILPCLTLIFVNVCKQNVNIGKYVKAWTNRNGSNQGNFFQRSVGKVCCYVKYAPKATIDVYTRMCIIYLYV